MKKKILIISLIILGVLGFVFYEPIWEKYDDWRGERERARINISLKKYAQEQLEKINTVPWKKFDNKYLSFEYPENWTLEDATGKNEGYLLSVGVRSPSLEDYDGLPPYAVHFSVIEPDKFASILPLDETAEKELAKAVRNGDLKTISKYKYNFPGGPQGEFTTLNGKQVFVILEGNQHLFYGAELYFVVKGGVLRVKVVDFTLFPLPEITSASNDLLSYMNSRAYSKILSTIKVK